MPQRHFKLFLYSFLAVACATVKVTAQTGNLRAGAARVDITPTADEFPFPVGQFAPFIGVHDPVYTRALVLDDGSTELAIVLVDVTAIPKPEEFKLALTQTLGIPEANLLLVASHTHSVLLLDYFGGEPSAGEAHEIERVRQAAVNAVREAKAQLRPARIAFTRDQAWVNVNLGEGAGPAQKSNFHGPSDKSLDVLRVQGTDGKPIAVLADYGVPSSVMIHLVTRDGGSEVSGDLLGVAAQDLEKQMNGAVVLFATGAGGDQRALFQVPQSGGPRPGMNGGPGGAGPQNGGRQAGAAGPAGGAQQQPAGETQKNAEQQPVRNDSASGWVLLNAMAKYLSDVTLAATDAMQAGTDNVKLSAQARTVECPGEKRTVDRKTGKATVEDTGPVKIPLNLIRINDIALAGVGGNVASEIGEKFKSASPLPQSTMISETSGSVGYILSDAGYAHPSHGSPLKAGCAENAIVQGLVDMTRGQQ